MQVSKIFTSAVNLLKKTDKSKMSHLLTDNAADNFIGTTLKFTSPRIKSAHDFNYLDVLTKFKSKEKLAFEHNTSASIVEQISNEVAKVKKYISENSQNIVEKNLNTANYTIKFKDGIKINLREPHNMHASDPGLQKLITITSDNHNKTVFIPAYSNINSSELFELFGFIDKLHK